MVMPLKNSKWIVLRKRFKGTFKVILSFFPNVCTYAAYLELDSDLSTVQFEGKYQSFLSESIW